MKKILLKSTPFLFLMGIAVFQYSNPNKVDRQLASSKRVVSKRVFRLKKNVKNFKSLQRFSKRHNLSEMEFVGRLETDIAEDFNSNDFEQTYYIHDGRKRTQVHFLNEQHKELVGKEIQFNAVQLENKVYGIAKLDSNLSKRESIETKNETMLILLANFNDSNTPPHQWPDGKPVVEPTTLASHLNEGAFADYFKQVTQGRISNTVTRVEDWHTFDRNADELVHGGASNRVCYVTKSEIMNLLIEKGIDHTQFDNISVISNCYTFSNWGVASAMIFPDGHRVSLTHSSVGRFNLHLGNQDDLVPGWSEKFLTLFTHERLHNYFIGHSKGLDCDNSSVLFPCEVNTYANPFDVMGRGRTSNALNADSLKKAGWRDNKLNFHHITKPGIYSIDPLLAQDGNAKIGAYIYSPFSNSNRPVYMVENRIDMGIDGALHNQDFADVINGLTLYTSISTSRQTSSSQSLKSPSLDGFTFRIMDPKPGNYPLADFPDRIKHDAITARNVYFDPITGIKIKPLSKTAADKLFFEVSYDDERRVCFKQRIAEQSGDVYIQNLNMPVFRAQAKKLAATNQANVSIINNPTVILKHSHAFRFKVNTILSNPEMCPRDTIQVRIKDAANTMEQWAMVKHANTDKPPRPIPPHIEDLYVDYNNFNLLGSVFQVKEDAPLGSYTLTVEYKNLRSKETRTTYINVVVQE